MATWDTKKIYIGSRTAYKRMERCNENSPPEQHLTFVLHVKEFEEIIRTNVPVKLRRSILFFDLSIHEWL